ncbi:hypothetical protein [Campylobacter sp. 19-13652]|nr:hypothetical protein [Campylobacter sp. 19-13652]BCX78858.1 hypothetical protein LBC_03200 [Campylobacter sp. 19-13652]
MSSATVKSLSIKAYAIDKNGQRRELKVGDSLDNGEIVKTAIGGGRSHT